jgi:protein TonB
VAPRFTQADIARAEQQYLNALSETLARHAQNTYPRIAQRRGLQGEVYIRFTLLANGQIIDIEIIDSSGQRLLDNAALEIFETHMRNQFKPFPEQINRERWTHTVPIEYKLR